jgi:hypothetical protein
MPHWTSNLTGTSRSFIHHADGLMIAMLVTLALALGIVAAIGPGQTRPTNWDSTDYANAAAASLIISQQMQWEESVAQTTE